MATEPRKMEMRDYQRVRSGARREIGQVTRTAWIRGEDSDAFAEAIRPFTDHARLLEAVNGALDLSAMELTGIVREHQLPYEPEEVIFLSRIEEYLTLHPDRTDRVVHTAHQIMDKYPEVNFSGVMRRLDQAAPPLDLGLEDAEIGAGAEP